MVSHSARFSKLRELLIRELRLRRSTAANHVHFTDSARREGLQRVRRDVGMTKFVRCLEQHPSDVQRNVAMADDDRNFMVEIEAAVAKLGMAVVPGDKIARGVTSWQAFAGDVEGAADFGAGRQNHGVIVGAQFGDLDVATDADPPDETKAGHPRDAIEDRRDLFQLGMIGGDAKPHEPVRRRQSLEHVDRDPLAGTQERLGGVETARSATHDRDPQGGALVERRSLRRHARGWRHGSSGPFRVAAPASGVIRPISTGVSAARTRLISIHSLFSAGS